MFLFQITPENRILVELLVIVFAALIAVVIENPGAPAPKTESAASNIAQVAPGH